MNTCINCNTNMELGTDHFNFFGDVYCYDCYSELFSSCEVCGDTDLYYNLHAIFDYNIDSYTYVCDTCLDDAFYCSYHDRLEVHIGVYELTNYNEKICSEALYYGEYSECYTCGDIHHQDNIHWNDNLEEYQCEACYSEYQNNNKIKEYHHHKDNYEYNMNLINKELDNMTIGFELEIEAGDKDNNTIVSEIIGTIGEKFIVFEDDSSLREGVELISYPFNNSYFSSYGKEYLKLTLDILNRNNNRSEDTSTCGLHFHVGRKCLGSTREIQGNTIKNIMIVLEYFHEELFIISNRTEETIKRWSSFNCWDVPKKELTIEYIEDNINSQYSRYSALNIENTETIEFRFLKGTLNYNTFMSLYELINNIVHYSIENNVSSLEDLDYRTIFTYRYNSYINSYLDKKLL